MPKYTVSEFEGDMPLENSWQMEFDSLAEAKAYAVELDQKRATYRARKYRIDVYRIDSGFCFRSIPRRK